MIRVAIADDQVLLRDMLRIMLIQDEEIEVVGCAGNGREIIDICEKFTPDIVLMDIRMPEVNGIEALIEIKKSFPTNKIIMLTTFEDQDNITEAYKNGADGYILKDVKPNVLILAVKCIHNDLFVMHKSVHQFIKEQFTSSFNDRVTVSTHLEDIEFDNTDLQIMRLLAYGNNNKEIAEALNFSEGTIKNRISKILSITGLKDRTQIAVFALKNKLI